METLLKKIANRFIILLLIIVSNSDLLIASLPKNSIQNQFFKVFYESKGRVILINRSDNRVLISGAVSAVNTNHKTYLPDSHENNYSVKINSVQNDIGRGQMITIFFKDTGNRLDIEREITIYDSLQAIIFETKCTNISSEKMVIKSIEPVRIIKSESGTFFWNDATKCLTNGAMYYDAGMIHEFGNDYIKPEPYGESKGGVMINNSLTDNKQTIQSWWNTALFCGYNNEGVSLGYIENKVCLGRIQLLKTDSSQFSLVAESVFNPGFVLQPGQTVSSDRFIVNIAENTYKAMEDYADVMSRISSGLTGSIVNGWCNWFYTLDYFNEDEIVQNAKFAATHLKQYGLEYIQIDEGFQTWHGEWEGNSRFPHGLKWLASQIKAVGLKPGIWIAPFVVSDTTQVFKQHPDWFLKNEDGSLKRIGPWPGENTDWFINEKPKRYCLDITHPGAEKWFTDLIDTIANSWGYEMIKIDFVAWTVFSANHFYDQSFTPAQVYAKAIGIVRSIAGDKCHILDCGPGNTTTGLINSMRIEYDQNYGYANDVWKQYFIGNSCSAGATAKRYFYHNRTWINDADHVCIDMLPMRQAQAAASIIALSGGNMMSGDRLTDIDNAKLEILRKVLPSTGINARPADLFDTDPQTIFVSKVDKRFDQWTIAGFFNPDLNNRAEKNLPFDRLWLDPNKTYLCYDFWNEQFFGEISRQIKVSVDPGSVKLLSIHEKKDYPQFIGTTRHIMQGIVEIEDIRFDTLTNTLSGISVAPTGSAHDVIVYIPDTYQWSPVQNKLYDDFENYSIKKTNTNIMRVRLHFENTSRINWKVVFSR